MKVVYILHHVTVYSEVEEDVKLIGVFSTEVAAQKVIKELETKPGFVNAKDGFEIDKYVVDQYFWKEGFGL